MRRLLIDLRRRAQTNVLRAARGSRFFPRTLVDRQGDDLELQDASIDAAVMVYFPGALDTLYQITPWLPTFEAVHDAHRAVIVCQDSRVAAHLRRTCRVPVLTVARYGTLDGLLSRSDVGLALYVSHLPRNFENLRFSSLLHAYIGHGDSDKGVSASNQLKAYDYFFAPGAAAVERVAARLMRFDAEGRALVVGQPVTLSAPPADGPPPAVRSTVLYAPTWEGAQPSVAYSSVLSHGEAMVGALLADGRYRVLYRPHPLTGVTSRLYAVADRAIREAIGAAGADHEVVDADAEPVEATMARSHLLVADVSAVTTAWLPSLRPLVVTEAGGGAQSADSGLLGAVPRLPADRASRVAEVLAEAAADVGARERRRRLVEHYLSPYWPEGCEHRFVEVVGQVLEERARLRAVLTAGGATGV
ncbi:glycosyl transferase [Amnibacterium endophyticum]|uniref:Glycosyl transferase n=1 Tax=Amnibacterium endophyticum TaxID=2109337 RepID=A0ABW4LDH1_9MICO